MFSVFCPFTQLCLVLPPSCSPVRRKKNPLFFGHCREGAVHLTAAREKGVQGPRCFLNRISTQPTVLTTTLLTKVPGVSNCWVHGGLKCKASFCSFLFCWLRTQLSLDSGITHLSTFQLLKSSCCCPFHILFVFVGLSFQLSFYCLTYA